MTRVNTIHVHLLTNNQLIAEYREIPRIINRVVKGKLYKEIPDSYRMGQGHESFFGDKLKYIHVRHQQILSELAIRKELYPTVFKSDYIIDTTQNYKKCKVLFSELCNNWTPHASDVCTNLYRLIERQYLQKKQDKYGDKPIYKEFIADDWLFHVCNTYKNPVITNFVHDTNLHWKVFLFGAK